MDGLKLYKQYLENIRLSISNYKLPELKDSNIVSLMDRTREIEDLSYIDVILENANVGISFLGEKSFLDKKVVLTTKLPDVMRLDNEEENAFLEDLFKGFDLSEIEVFSDSQIVETTEGESEDYCSLEEVMGKHKESLSTMFSQLVAINKAEEEQQERIKAFEKAEAERLKEEQDKMMSYVEDSFDFDDEDDEDAVEEVFDEKSDEVSEKDILDIKNDIDDENSDDLWDFDSEKEVKDDSSEDLEELEDILEDDLNDVMEEKSFETLRYEPFTDEDLDSRSVLADLWKEHFGISAEDVEDVESIEEADSLEETDGIVEISGLDEVEDDSEFEVLSISDNSHVINSEECFSDEIDISKDLNISGETDFDDEDLSWGIDEKPKVNLGKSLLEDDELDTDFLFNDSNEDMEVMEDKESEDEPEIDEDEEAETDFNDIFGNRANEGKKSSKLDKLKSESLESNYEQRFKKKNFDTFLEDEEDITGKLLSEELEDDEESILRDTDPPDRSMFQEATDYFINGDKKRNPIKEIYTSKEKIVDSDDFTGLDDMLAKAILAVSDNLWALPKLFLKGKAKGNNRKFYESMIVEEEEDDE